MKELKRGITDIDHSFHHKTEQRNKELQRTVTVYVYYTLAYRNNQLRRLTNKISQRMESKAQEFPAFFVEDIIINGQASVNILEQT